MLLYESSISIESICLLVLLSMWKLEALALPLCSVESLASFPQFWVLDPARKPRRQHSDYAKVQADLIGTIALFGIERAI